MASSASITSLNETHLLSDYSGHKLIAVSVTLIATVALIALEILCIILSFVSRHLSKTVTGLNDWLLLPAFVFCFGLPMLSICMCSNVFISLKTLIEMRLFRNPAAAQG